MKNTFSYFRPFLSVLSFFGCYMLFSGMTGALLIPMLGQIDLVEMTPAEWAGLQSNPLMLLLMQMSSLLSLLITLFIFVRLPPARDYISVGITGSNVLKDIGLGCLVGVGIIGASFLLMLLTGVVESVSLNGDFDGRNLLNWFLIYVIVAFVEEAMSRGYFLSVFMEKYSPLMSVLITSLIFSLMHLMNPSFGWTGFLNIFLAGLLMGLAFFRRRSIWLPMGLHFGWNFMQGTVLGFNVSGIDAETLLRLQLSGHPLLNGGDFGLEGSLLTTLVCLIAAALLFYYGNLSFQPIEFEENEPD